MNITLQEKWALHIIDAWLNHRLRYSNLPGFQVCLRKGKEVILNRSYGYANLKTKRKLTTHDLFHIASHSKVFTSCAILRLIEKGRLGFDHLIIRYIPELKNHSDKRFQNITIRDLLSHRSGIFRDGPASDFWRLYKPFPSKEQLLQEILSADLIFTPNTYTKYSNSAFSLLGLVIEKLLGSSYNEAIHTLVLKDLSGKFFPDYLEEPELTYADGHSRGFFENIRAPLKHAPALALTSATGFCGTAEDTSLFFESLFLGKDLLKKEMRQELISLNWPVKNLPQERYGLGVLFSPFAQGMLVGHSGGYPGFRTYTVNWVGTDYVISFFLNTIEAIPFNAVKSIFYIIHKIKEVFTNSDLRNSRITPFFMTETTAIMCLLAKKKGIAFSLGSWSSPYEESLILTTKDGEKFLSPDEHGYLNAGEFITFNQDKEENITSMKWAGSTLFEEKIFLKKIQDTFL